MTERKITRKWTPNGWLEYFEPDWNQLRATLAAQPPPSPEEQIAAGRRYMLACWNASTSNPTPRRSEHDA